MLQDKFADAFEYIDTCVLERTDEIKLMLAAVIAGQHVFLIGPPGTAKSMMIMKMMDCFADGSRLFKKLLSETTEYEEVMGPLSLQALKQDQYRYKTEGYLPDAEFAFLDEIWKCGSALLNGLLTATNEREFHNGNEVVDIPLQTLFCASNELPQDSSLGALYDRMLVRMECPPLLRTASKKTLLERADGSLGLTAPKTLTADDIVAARAQVNTIGFADDATMEKWLELQQEIKTEMSETCYVSDRRWMAAYNMLKAVVWLEGADEITRDDFIYAEDMLWESPDQKPAISGILGGYLSKVTNAAQELYNRVEAIYLDMAEGNIKPSEMADVYNNACEIRDELEDLSSEAGADTAAFKRFTDKANAMVDDIVDAYLETAV